MRNLDCAAADELANDRIARDNAAIRRLLGSQAFDVFDQSFDMLVTN